MAKENQKRKRIKAVPEIIGSSDLKKIETKKQKLNLIPDQIPEKQLKQLPYCNACFRIMHLQQKEIDFLVSRHTCNKTKYEIETAFRYSQKRKEQRNGK